MTVAMIDARMCTRCQKRRAIAIRLHRREGLRPVVKVFSDHMHDLCPQCFRRQQEATRSQQLKEAESEGQGTE